MLLFAQVVVFGMVTFQAYCVGNAYGFKKGSDRVYQEIKEVFERLNLN